jgi:ornithine carbamoyltransferase
VAYIGDGNNVANSWIEAALLYGLEVRVACPEGYEPDPRLVGRVSTEGPGRVRIVRSPAEAAAGADVLYTDVWASMGQEAEREKRLPIFRAYQINASVLGKAKPGALVMHCLPAHRGEEITDEAIEGPQSVVFPQAENRMHLQKAILFDFLVAKTKSVAKRGNPPARRALRAKPAKKKAVPSARRTQSRSRR